MKTGIPRRIFLQGLMAGNAALLGWSGVRAQPRGPGSGSGPAALADQELFLALDGEDFEGLGDFAQTGWRVGFWETDAYQTCTFGGVHFARRRFLLGAAGARDAAVSKDVMIPAAGLYRVWVKYEAPPGYNTRFDVRIMQNGVTVFDQPYGGVDHLRQYAFTRENRAQQYWPWGTDHDVGEGLDHDALLDAGPATIVILQAENPEPAAERHIDCLMLTSNLSPITGPPSGQVHPLLDEITSQTFVYLRFSNPAGGPFPQRGTLTRNNHRSPWTLNPPVSIQQPVAPGWIEPGDSTPWIAVKVDVATDTTLTITTQRLEGGMARPNESQDFTVELAGDPDGGRPIRALRYTAASPSFRIEVPSDWTYQPSPAAVTRTAEEICTQLLADVQSFPDFGAIPRHIRFYGTVGSSNNPAVADLLRRIKARLGYNTIGQRTSVAGVAAEVAAFIAAGGQLIERSLTFVHTFNPTQIQNIYDQMLADGTLAHLDYLSYGDEIHPPRPPTATEMQREALRPVFIQYLMDAGVTPSELGLASLAEARIVTLAQVRDEGGSTRLFWFSELFLEQSGLNAFAERTALVESLFGTEVKTGANYSPHPMYWFDIGSWIDVYKQRAATMPWSEDFIFSQPEVSRQVFCYLTDMARAGARYHDLGIRMYVMPHAPSNTPSHVRMNTYAALAHGAKVIDSFWCGPQMFFTENFVRQDQLDMYHTLHDVIREVGIAEDLVYPGRVRRAQVALLVSRATDLYDKSEGSGHRVPESAPPDAAVDRSLYNEERKNLYYALRHAQIAVDLVTEDDIAEGYLGNYRVLYVVGDRVHGQAASAIADWVFAGGVLFSSAGGGFRNQYDEPSATLAPVYGVDAQSLTKTATVLRAKMELPRTTPLDQVTFQVPGSAPAQLEALAYKQTLTAAPGAQVLGTYADGSPAIVQNDYGQGRAILVGTLPGAAYVKPAIPLRPMDKGGHDGKLSQLIPTGFARPVRDLIEYPALVGAVVREVVASADLVELTVLDSPGGLAVPLINYSTQPIADLEVRIRNVGAFARVRTIAQPSPTWRLDGDHLIVTLPLDLTEMILVYR